MSLRGYMKLRMMCLAGCVFSSLAIAQSDNIEQNEMNQAAFDSVKESLAPLDVKQIKDIRRLFNKIQRAGSFKEDVPPRPTSSSVVVDLSPGATPPVIRLAAGYVSSLVFVDSSGAPWPIKAYDIGNPQHFNVQWNQNIQDEKKGDSMLNTLLIQAQTLYREANLAVVLRGLNTPVMITLIPGQKAVDYRVDLRIPKLGPNAKPNIVGLPSEGSPVLIDILNGVSPHQAKRHTLRGGKGSAWTLGTRMYIKTPYKLVSPSWSTTVSGADGTSNVYEISKSSVLLMLDHGRLRKLTVEGI
ncbi:MAG TPA: DotH/IcmK family type IV secretion protein [Gammaproteobacteria bacterium]|nr:DotH/IcmK family type IV secretion protein [Gammaproteobacteria bacterium]